MSTRRDQMTPEQREKEERIDGQEYRLAMKPLDPNWSKATQHGWRLADKWQGIAPMPETVKE